MLAFEFKPKKKKIEFGRLPVKPAGKPVKPAGKSVKPTGKPVGTDWTCNFEFDFEFNRFSPVSGQTSSVNRYRTMPVWPDRSVYLTLAPAGPGIQLRSAEVEDEAATEISGRKDWGEERGNWAGEERSEERRWAAGQLKSVSLSGWRWKTKLTIGAHVSVEGRSEERTWAGAGTAISHCLVTQIWGGQQRWCHVSESGKFVSLLRLWW